MSDETRRMADEQAKNIRKQIRPPKYGVYRIVDGQWEHTEFTDAR